ncbi:MAG: hypothetical protein HLX51_04685 [Micrococcaceae bacterium]|nr:hypothetical protein [Micrococcaceae bacterium]
MEHTLSVHMEADVLPGPVLVKAKGSLTAETCPSLFDILDPALALSGCPSVTVDLLEVAHLETGGVQRLERYVSHYQAETALPAISIIEPQNTLRVEYLREGAK